MRARPLLVISTVAIALTAGCGGSAGTTGTTSTTGTTRTAGSAGSNGLASESGDQIVAAAVAATKAQSSFHFVESAGSGTSGVTIVGDVGTSSGEQHITVGNGSSNGHVTVLLSAKTAYFSGDAVGLEGFTGLTVKLATPLVGKWISVPSTSPSFASLAASLAVPTAAAQLVKLGGTLTRGGASKTFGRPSIAVKATQSSSSGSLSLTMYVSTAGAALPILVEGTTQVKGSAARSVSARFSGWGEAVRVVAPKSAVPITSVKSLAG
jgi:hypothetical protein